MAVELLDEKRHRASVRRLNELDWDFPSQFSESPFSALHWHPCRFPSQIPSIGLARLTGADEIVLDPFMGSATTLVEAQRLGRKSVGIDINPISCLIAKAKTLTVASPKVQRYVDKIRLLLTADWEDLVAVDIPNSVQANKWYMPETLTGLRKIWGIVNDDGPLCVVGRAAFSSILLGCCRETRHWGYICDNTTPKSAKVADPKALFISSLERFAQAYRNRDLLEETRFPHADVIEGDAALILEQFPNNLFSCVVTSPPYFGVADYAKAQRLSMEWFSLEIEPVRLKEIGARSKRHRKSALDCYINDLGEVFRQTHRVMKPGGLAVVVFGQSPKRPDAYMEFVKTLKHIGYSLELEKNRQIPPTRRQMPSLSKETVLLLRK